jgi:hypothetical protein
MFICVFLNGVVCHGLSNGAVIEWFFSALTSVQGLHDIVSTKIAVHMVAYDFP